MVIEYHQMIVCLFAVVVMIVDICGDVKKKTMKRIRISNERLNCFGTRILTSGIDITQYERNPVLLWMHQRGEVIGFVKDLRVDNDELTGELVFDEVTDLSRRLKRQFGLGSLRMVSVGIDILETSEDAKFLVEGQTAPTITKSKLFEVSLVDIGANDDALVLQKDGVRLTLGKNAADVLPLLHINNNNKGTKEMDKEKLALQLGLPKDADETAIEAELTRLQASKADADTLRQERDTLRAAQIETIVNAAIAEKKIGDDKKQQFLELGNKIGAEELQKTFDAMSPRVKLSDVVNSGGSIGTPSEYKKLSDVPSEELASLKERDLSLYKRLYKAEYGFEYD